MYSTVTVKQVLDRKGHNVWSLDPEVSVLDALKFMAEKNIGAVVVIVDKKPVGIFSERDYARKVVLSEKNEADTHINEVMTHQVIAVEPHYEIEKCLALMTGKFIRHLPVVNEHDEIIGVVSIGDLVKELLAEQKFVIDQLVHYITGEQRQPSNAGSSDVEIP